MMYERIDISTAGARWPMGESDPYPREVLYRHVRERNDESLKAIERAGYEYMYATVAWCRARGKNYTDTLAVLLGRFSSEATDFGSNGEARAAYLVGMGSAVYPIQTELARLVELGEW